MAARPAAADKIYAEWSRETFDACAAAARAPFAFQLARLRRVRSIRPARAED